MKQTILSILLAALALLPSTMKAQRVQQPLGRGVVAVYGTNNGENTVFVSWRRLAQEPEDARYNIYVSQSAEANFVKVNAEPLANTFFRTKLATIPYGSYVAVTLVDGDKEGKLSKPFLFKKQAQRNVFMEIPFDGSPLDKANYRTKFVWPCDLDGDGEYDYVVDRLPKVSGDPTCLEGYLADGTFLWNIQMGPNEVICDGQHDNLCAYDIDCDGFGEVIVQTSDGTRFWDKTTGTWGKYPMGSTTADTDGDGIVNYYPSGTDPNPTKNAPRYMTVVNGLTGEEKTSVEFQYDNAYNRTNKAELMGDEYNKHEAHVGIIYHDGVHPAVSGQWSARSKSGEHMYRLNAFAFDFDAEGKASNWHQLFMNDKYGSEFHQLRIYDADGDGKDEMSDGGYVMDHDGSKLFSANIAHGDRHRTSDIDPERPGLETFAIQQNASDMLGMILFDAGTGEPIKKWYMPSVGDMGRGECMDLDPDHIGWEMFAFIDDYQLYDAKGNKIEGKKGYYPTEGIWWDGALDRESVDQPGGDNVMISKYGVGRLYEISKESGWTIHVNAAVRPCFWGDIMGDWREEIIMQRDNGGIVGFTTDYKTDVDNIYCLQQDPHYRADCTTRGYYQSPNPGFYLGYDMPRPQLPPCMVADEETDVFGITLGDATTTPRSGMKNIYAMPVKGQTLTLASALESETTLWKSQQGVLAVNGEIKGKTIISEGTVCSGAKLNVVDLRARGTLAGAASVDTLIIEGALNYEGGRLIPDVTMTVAKTITVPAKKKLYVELQPGRDILKANINLEGTIVFTIGDDLLPGTYTLVEGCDAIDTNKLEVRGLTGKSFTFACAEGKLTISIHEQREATAGVLWTGAESTTWDYQTQNFSLNGESTNFVAGDEVTIGDEAISTTISLPVLYPTGGVTFIGSKKFTVQGDGGFSGEGGLTVDMDGGSVTLNATHSDYTGITRLLNGTVTVNEIADRGLPSSLGASSSMQMARAKLVINNSNAATDRPIELTDTATISIASGTAALKGKITGAGVLVKEGAGQVNITYSGTNSWAGTILKGGTLAMGAWNTTFGKSNSPINVKGNSTIVIFDSNSQSTMPSLQNVITIDKGKTLTVKGGSRCYVKGSLKGKGTYKISFPYVRGDVSTNTALFEGTYEVASDNCRFAQNMNLAKAVLKLDAEGRAYGTGTYTHKIGSLSGSGTLGTNTWNVGYLNLDDTFDGKLEADAKLQKYGTGTLNFNGTAESQVNVIEGTLAGTGTLRSVTVKENACIGAGKGKSTTGTLNLNGSLTVEDGGRIRVRYRVLTSSIASDKLNVKGAVTLNSPVIELTALNETELPDNAQIQLFTGTGSVSISGDVTILPTNPKTGWRWDASKLETDGILRIVNDVTAISETNSDKATSSPIYDIYGRKVNNPTHGIYIINGKRVIIK